MRRFLSIGTAITVLAVLACAESRLEKFTASVKDKPAPDFELSDLSGHKVKLSSLRGKPVLLAFWAFG